jgi:hypothetical protein
MNDYVSVLMNVILVCMTIMVVTATIMFVYLLFAHGKEIYDEFRRSGRWLK